MPTSRRRDLVNYIVTELKNIDGGTSSYDASYTYSENVFNNVFRRAKFLDEVNDFPSVYLQADAETRSYQSKNLAEGTLPIAIRIFARDTDTSSAKVIIENLINDIEHVIYSLDTNTLGIQDIIIDRISNDEGLFEPFGLGEVFITIQYELSD